jgi:hypothetical protein
MAKKYKVGQKLTNANGDKVVITSILPNGAATVNYAAGSGKTGYAGMITANLLTKYGLMPYSNLRVKEIEAEEMEYEDRNFSFEDYENYIKEEQGNETAALERALLDARQLNLKQIDEDGFSSLEIAAAEEAKSRRDIPIDGTGHRRAYYNVYRFMIESYSKAYGASEEFDLARAKVSMLYQFSKEAGSKSYRNDNSPSYDFTKSAEFGEAFSKAIKVAKNPESTYDDIFATLGEYGFCPYNSYLNDSHSNHDECKQKFKTENPNPEYFWPLPSPKI